MCEIRLPIVNGDWNHKFVCASNDRVEFCPEVSMYVCAGCRKAFGIFGVYKTWRVQ
jgi:hypothetical protein